MKIIFIIAICLLVVATIIVVWGALTHWTFKCKKKDNYEKTINWKKFPKEKKRLISTAWGNGFHNYCDWSIGDRWDNHTENYCFGNPDKLPNIIFVTCRGFKFFFNEIYPFIPNNHKYILIIADEDMTIPRQIDHRSAKDIVMSSKQWDSIVNDKQIIHIFASHLDIPATKRYSPFPVGFNPHEFKNNNIDNLLLQKVDNDIMSRPLKIKFCGRIRGGKQWEDRRIVKNLCETVWSKFSHSGNIPKEHFFDEIQKYSFLLCTHGGGIEPNPKAFSAIYCCTIPIMKYFVNCEILFFDLPVIFIDDWKAENVTLEKLKDWREKLKPYFSGKKREAVLEKLTSKYWMKYILNRAK